MAGPGRGLKSRLREKGIEMRKETYNCDICGVERREANHWFFARSPGPGTLTVLTWEAAWALGTSAMGAEGMLHLCGTECLQRYLGRWIDSIPSTTLKLVTNK